MNLNFLRLMAVVSFLFYFNDGMAGAWEKDIKRIVIPFGLTADKLPDSQSKSAALYAKYCSQCHNLPSPRMHSADEWPLRFEKMMDHARLMAGTSARLMAGASPAVKMPTFTEKEEIASYLGKNGFIELPANSPLLGEPQAFNVLWFCSVCHAVPDPDQFPADEWSKIVDRMNGYRKKQGRDEMSNADRKAIINFLAKKRP